MKNKKKEQNSDELFDFKDEIVIGINNTSSIKSKKKTKKTNNNTVNEKSSKNKNTKNTKKNKEQQKNNELFDFKDEIVIGINSPKAIKEKKANSKKNNKPVKKRNVSKKIKTKDNSRLKVAIKWTILLLLLVGAIIYFMMSPLFNLRELTITGTSKISEHEVESLSQIQMGENIYKFSKLKAIEYIESNPYIASVEIKRQLPDKVVINITERVATFLMEFGNAYIYIDNQGYSLEVSDEKAELPIISSLTTDVVEFKPGNRLIKEDLVKLEKIIEITSMATSNEIYEKIEKIEVSNNSYTLIMNDNKIAYLGDASNLNVKMLYLKKILELEEGVAGEIFLDGSNKDIYFREKV